MLARDTNDTSSIRGYGELSTSPEKALLIGLVTGGAGAASRTESSIAELGQLAESAGATVVGQVVQERQKPDPATLIGRGKLDDVSRVSDESGANLLLFDDELSP